MSKICEADVGKSITKENDSNVPGFQVKILHPAPIFKRVDSVGRVVLPKDHRDKLNMENRSPVHVWLVEDGFYVRVLPYSCFVCRRTVYSVPIHIVNPGLDNEVYMCKDCISKVKDIDLDDPYSLCIPPQLI